MARFDLTDLEWLVIQPLLPTKVQGVKRVDDRRVLKRDASLAYAGTGRNVVLAEDMSPRTCRPESCGAPETAPRSAGAQRAHGG